MPSCPGQRKACRYPAHTELKLTIMIKRILFSFVAMICTSAVAMADTDISGTDNILYTKPVTVKAGDTGQLSICMKNSVDVQTIGSYFYMPEGTTVLSDDDGLKIKLSNDRTSAARHELFSNYVADADEYRIGILQTSGSTFSGSDGEVATVDFSVADDVTPGNYTVKLAQQELSNTSGQAAYKMVYEGTITVTKADGIHDVTSSAANGADEIYTAGGMKVKSLQKGLNIVRQKGNKTIKIAK